jgi:hypothetical protein
MFNDATPRLRRYTDRLGPRPGNDSIGQQSDRLQGAHIWIGYIRGALYDDFAA